jgi:hypothetical protein
LYFYINILRILLTLFINLKKWRKGKHPQERVIFLEKYS